MAAKPPRYSKAAQLGIVIGAILIFFGIIQLSERFFGSTWWGFFLSALSTFFSFAWPIALIAAGVYLVWAAKAGKFKHISVDGSRPFRRSLSDKRIAGVCGGIAQYFNIDSTIVRVLAVILLVVSPGFTLFVYVVAAILMPKS